MHCCCCDGDSRGRGGDARAISRPFWRLALLLLPGLSHCNGHGDGHGGGGGGGDGRGRRDGET